MKKKQKIVLVRIMLFTGTIVSLFFVPWILVWAWILPLPDTVQEQLNEGIGHGFDGMIAYVDEAGKPPAFYAAGWHDRKNKIPARPDALFKIGSISKLYVAVAITKLVKEKQLSLDKTLVDYFPELEGRIEYADQITVRLMVQHRSGMPSFTNHPGFWENAPNSNADPLELALDLLANFEPGTDYEYCNTNYLLLSRLIEKVTGSPRQQYFREEILTPLGLNNTYGSLNDVQIEDLMSGYYVGVEQDIKTNDYGIMIATAEDVGKFLRALNDGSVFDEGEQEIYSSIYVYDHGGLVPGYQSLAEYHKDIDTVIVQFVNTTDFNGYEWNLSEIICSRIAKIVRRNKD